MLANAGCHLVKREATLCNGQRFAKRRRSERVGREANVAARRALLATRRVWHVSPNGEIRVIDVNLFVVRLCIRLRRRRAGGSGLRQLGFEENLGAMSGHQRRRSS